MGAAATNMGFLDAVLIMVMVGGMFGIIDTFLGAIHNRRTKDD